MATTTTEASITTSWSQIATGVTALIAQMKGQGKVLIHGGASAPGSEIGVLMDHRKKPDFYIPDILAADKVFAVVKGEIGDTATLTLVNFAP